ncbi:DNA primase [Calderihabitans maritimus]|uniref:DNA primase n=1 Tax=Calderihabitans maritimus TaxID=1246530 RepID=A0A1Z5HRE3_9FIRM|nr:DNA primase [Calderihabitans maritimus]
MLKKQGKNYTGLCPFHVENTPSFTVNPEKQLFYCFGCGVGGNVFTFLMKIENLSFPEAVERLAERAGISLPRQEFSPAVKKKKEERERLFRINRLAAHFYQTILARHPAGKEARNYLLSRGLTEEIIEHFGLGYAPDSWDGLLSYLRQKNISQEDMVKAGLIVSSGKGYYDRFRNRIMFPIHDERGRILGFGGRVLDGSLPKYLNTPETVLFHKGKVLYGLPLAASAIRRHDQAIVVEGYMDVLAAHQYGFTNTVASLGTALTVEQGKLLRRFTSNVAIGYDADTAGAKATLRGLDVLRDLGFQVKVIALPEGMDPDDLLRQRGTEAMEHLINSALTLMEYKLEQAIAAHDTNTVTGKVEAVNSILPDLAKIENSIARQSYVQKIAERIGIPGEAVYQELRKYIRKKAKPGPWKDKKGKNRDNNNGGFLNVIPGHIRAEWTLLRLMLEDPEVRSRVREELPEEMLSDAKVRSIIRILSSLEEDYGRKVSDAAELVDLFREEEDLQKFVVQLFWNDNFTSEKSYSVEDCLYSIKLHWFESQVKEIQEKIKEAESENREEELVGLLKEIEELQKSIYHLKSSRQTRL